MEFQVDALLMLFTKSIVQLIPISVDHRYAMNQNVHFRILLKLAHFYCLMMEERENLPRKKCKSKSVKLN